ncbi:hypothetical protein [Clostridium perfringens]|uniref:hypothetical protein n=1 Tax=Clostridium perfringens TaxID=1502 RepID=UPI000763E788|nr:hypothetical protein [Clostridium perfringens]
MKKTRFIKLILFVIILFLGLYVAQKILIYLSVKEPIESLLEKFFVIELSSNEEDCSNLVSDKKIADIYNLKFKNLRESNQFKENKKLKINIKDVDKIENNKYIVNFSIIREFTIKGSKDKSYAKDEYSAEIIKDNGKFLISKLLDYFDYIQFLNIDETTSTLKNIPNRVLYSKQYDLIMENKKNKIENFTINKFEK